MVRKKTEILATLQENWNNGYIEYSCYSVINCRSDSIKSI